MENQTSFIHYSFPSIEQFRNVIRNVKHKVTFDGLDENGQAIYVNRPLPTLKFKGTVKLHGTNAGVIIDRYYNMSAQSRENVLSIMKDNAGFCMYAINVPMDVYRKFTDPIFEAEPGVQAVGIYGEWCGGSIQKGVALNQLDKMFVVFNVKKLYSLDAEANKNAKWVSYEQWKDINAPENKLYNIHQFQTWDMDIDFNEPKLAQNKLIELTMEVEKTCPVGKYFGVDGIGEGIVWTCQDPNYFDSGFWMKVKGEKHQSSKVKTLAPIDVEKVNSVKEFVNNVLTESRLNQGLDKLKENNLPLDRTSIGAYLKWIVGDVFKEEGDTIIQNQLEPKMVASQISNVARKWFFDNEINF